MGKKDKWGSPIRHEQVYLRTRGHNVDIHVYPVMQKLWDKGIQTFFSCQGGPSSLFEGRKIESVRAYVIVLQKDEAKALKVLRRLNPTVEPWENRDRRDQISIKFDPSPEAQAVLVEVRSR